MESNPMTTKAEALTDELFTNGTDKRADLKKVNGWRGNYDHTIADVSR